MWLVTDGLETDGIQGDVRFLGTNRLELEKELSVVSGQMHQRTSREDVRAELT